MRLMLLAHGPTERARDLVFGDGSGLAGAGRATLAGLGARMPVSWLCGPEPACVATAEAGPEAGLEAADAADSRPAHEPVRAVRALEVLEGLRGPDFAAWQGLSLPEVMASDPVGVQAWLTDPTAAPHGGESLAALVVRVGAVLDNHDWPAAGASVVVAPLVARAALVHALGAPAESLLHVDVAPLTVLRLSRERGTWRLSGLVPTGSAAGTRVGEGMRKGPE